MVRVELSESDPVSSIGVEDHVYDIKNAIYIIILAKPLKVDKIYEVLIPFKRKGSLHRPRGYSIDQYEDTSQNGQKYVVTQLGIADARSIFPCFDQIYMKAKFKIFLKHSEHFMAFSNTEKKNTETETDIANYVEDEFTESPLMTTNNVAFALIDSKYFKLLDLSVHGTIKLFAAETSVNNMHFAHTAFIKTMDFYSDYFNSRYALPNLKIIALPPGFVDEDEEKYGIITLPDSSIMFSNESSQDKVDIIKIICHAMSHQWLGSYVTVSSWNTNWLHEAFVTVLEKPCLEYV
ncbi:hypothetical protein V9T40_005227 [Parthenolecanium corni]|uniref:Aminopeptidase N n=1 Tax=Parthenolecanium corni TaxID=536013 RepID=A0AAN9THI5_9HEMI